MFAHALREHHGGELRDRFSTEKAKNHFLTEKGKNSSSFRSGLASEKHIQLFFVKLNSIGFCFNRERILKDFLHTPTVKLVAFLLASWG